jgi:hypothetical protein
VQIQLWLTAAAMNIKRAVRRIATRGRPIVPELLLSLLLDILLLALNRSPHRSFAQP